MDLNDYIDVYHLFNFNIEYKLRIQKYHWLLK